MEDYDHVEDVGVIFPFTLTSFLRPFHFNHCSFLGFLSLKAEVISINPICGGWVWLIKIEKPGSNCKSASNTEIKSRLPQTSKKLKLLRSLLFSL